MRPVEGSLGDNVGIIKAITSFARRNILYCGLVVIVILLSLLSPVFLTVGNIFDIILQSSINGIIALGVTFVITTGGIDLSVGAIWGLSGVVCGLLLKAGVPWGLATVGCVLAGALCGMFSGVLITKGRIQAFIATLATMSVYRGITLIITKGYTVYNFPKDFHYLGAGRLFGVIPIPVLMLALVLLISVFLFERTTFGRYLVSIGNNKEAARLCGIDINKMITLAYVYAGVLCAIGGGLIATARLNAAEPIAGSGAETDAIAAVVIGGTSLAGGVAKIRRTVLGALLLGMTNNGLTLLNVPTYYKMAVVGLIIILAMLGDSMNKD
jgi:ribose transport system permease protein